MTRWQRPSAEQVSAFERFVVQNGPSLRRLSFALAASSADAEDLMQDTLVLVLERWDKVTAAREPYSYARRMMVNTSTSTWRRRRREMHGRSAEEELTLHSSGASEDFTLWCSDKSVTSDGEASFISREERTHLMAALKRIAPRQRTVVVLRYMEELPDAEVAELLGVSAVTVRSTALRALRALSATLKHDRVP